MKDNNDKRMNNKEETFAKKNRKASPVSNTSRRRKKLFKKSPSFTSLKIPVQDYEEQVDKKLSIPKKVRNVLIIVLVLTVAVSIWSNRQAFTPDNIQSFFEEKFLNIPNSAGFPSTISGTDVSPGNFQLSGNRIVTLSNTSITVLTNTGKRIYTRQHGFNNPVLKTSNSYSLVYNKNSGEFLIDNSSDICHRETLESDIQAAAVSDDGSYVIACKSKSYLSEMTFFFGDGTAKFKYNFSDCYVTDMCISSDSKYLVVSGLKAEKGDLKSLIYVFDISLNNVKTISTYDDAVVHMTFFSNPNSVGLVGQESCAFVDSSGNVKVHSYEGKTLSSYCSSADNVLSVTLSESSDKQNCTCYSYYANGEPQGSFATDLKIRFSSVNSGIFAFLSGSSAYFYTTTGVFIKSEPVGDDAKKGLMASNKECYILGASEIKKVNL